MLKLKANGHTINKDQIISVCKWDKAVNGYAGVVEYKQGGKTYMPNITKDELQAIIDMGFKPEFIPTKYTGTY